MKHIRPHYFPHVPYNFLFSKGRWIQVCHKKMKPCTKQNSSDFPFTDTTVAGVTLMMINKCVQLHVIRQYKCGETQSFLSHKIIAKTFYNDVILIRKIKNSHKKKWLFCDSKELQTMAWISSVLKLYMAKNVHYTLQKWMCSLVQKTIGRYTFFFWGVKHHQEKDLSQKLDISLSA